VDDEWGYVSMWIESRIARSSRRSSSDVAERYRVRNTWRLAVPGRFRVRRDKIDITGVVTIRHNSRLHHIGLGRRLIGTRVLVLIDGLQIRVISEDGELIREPTLDTSRDYQPHGRT
jgi:hypothetical protein